MTTNYIYDRIYIPVDNILDLDAFKADFYYEIEGYNKFEYIRNWSVNSKGCIVVPSGSWNKARMHLKEDRQELEDKRVSKVIQIPEFAGKLWEDQKIVVDEFLAGGANGFINSKAGSGKTVMACSIIAALKQKFLVIVPTSLLLHQWVERINKYIPGASVAKLGDGHNDYNGHNGLIAIIDSLSNRDNIDRFRSEFGVILMDEAHRLPANTYKDTINLLSAPYKIGLSANTTRKDKKHIVINDYLGDFMVVNESPNVFQAKIIIMHTGLKFQFNPRTDSWATTVNAICGDRTYNEGIANVVREQAKQGRKIAILTPRLFQIEQLQELLIDRKVGVITGQTKPIIRDQIIRDVNAGLYEILLCSKQIFEEGADIQRLDTIHLVGPSNNDEKLEQALGRVERVMPGKEQPLAYDYWFSLEKKNSLTRQQDARMNYYLSRGYEVEHDAFSVF